MGAHYEDVAQAWYVSHGFTIIARNLRVGRLEIDLIVSDPAAIIFVEVKGGNPDLFGHPAYRVDKRKRERLIRAAQNWLSENPSDGRDVRFDVFVVTASRAGDRIERYENAISVDDSL